MAFQLKSMLGHMMRPSHQAVAIASNNTDTMLAAIAPASPTLQAQQHLLASQSHEVILPPQPVVQSAQQSTSIGSQHANAAGRMMPGQAVGVGVGAGSGPAVLGPLDAHSAHTSRYAIPQLMQPGTAGPLWIASDPIYAKTTTISPPSASSATATPQPQIYQSATLAIKNQSRPIASFYMPQPLPHQSGARGGFPASQTAAQTAFQNQLMPQFNRGSNDHPYSSNRRSEFQNGMSFANGTMSGQLEHRSSGAEIRTFQNVGGQSDASNLFASQSYPAATHTVRPQLGSNYEPAKANFQATAPNSRGQLQNRAGLGGKQRKVEQLYFKSEAEAQAWEDSCAMLDAPAPTQFLQNVAKPKAKVATQTSQGNTLKKQQKQKASNKDVVSNVSRGQAGAISAAQTGEVLQQSFKMKFKTEICKFWQLNGTCEYSDACSFAHGSHELKQRTDMPRNYKTKQCKRFHKELYCPYGHRCQFLHDEPRVKASSKKQTAVAAKESLAAAPATFTYTGLLKNVSDGSYNQKGAALASKSGSAAKVPDGSTNTHRLQVFSNIPESLNDSQISIE